jgi:hypothetical protein
MTYSEVMTLRTGNVLSVAVQSPKFFTKLPVQKQFEMVDDLTLTVQISTIVLMASRTLMFGKKISCLTQLTIAFRIFSR